MKLIGVTGIVGKTSVCEVIYSEIYTYNKDILLNIKKNNNIIREFTYNNLFISNYKINSTINNLSWQGRLLTAFGNNIYSYNENGVRVKKVNNTTTNYTVDGIKVLKVEKNNVIIYYHFDENDNVVGLHYEEKEYFFERDILGNINKIIDIDKNILVNYTYTAFGIVSITSDNSSIGDILKDNNIYLYKGYIYDQETQLYYCITRYYDPYIGRFLSLDNIDYLDLDSISGMNLWVYCMNNPLMMIDSTGTFAISIFIGCIIAGAILGGVTSGLNAYNNGAYGWELVGRTALGTICGAAVGVGVGLVVGLGGIYLIGGMTSFIGKFTEDLFAYITFGTQFSTWEDFAISFIYGGLTANMRLPLKAFIDIIARPFVSQVIKIGTGRQNNFQWDKLGYDILTRGLTFGFPSAWKPFARGITRGLWDQWKKGNLDFSFIKQQYSYY